MKKIDIVMNTSKKGNRFVLTVGTILLFLFSTSAQNNYFPNNAKLDIIPYGKLCYWSEQTGVLGGIVDENGLIAVPKSAENEWNVGVWWKEARDINQIEITYVDKVAESLIKGTKVQYWFRFWPDYPLWGGYPSEDRMDGPWQGEWLTADTEYRIEGNKVIYTFNPLSEKENKLAGNLKDQVNYRRAIKFRLLYNEKPSEIQSIKVFTPTKSKKLSVRIELGCDKPLNKKVTGELEIFNGKIEGISGWKWNRKDKKTNKKSWAFQLNGQPKGIVADLVVAEPTIGGSNDRTIVTVRSSEGSFSFLTDDLKNGPVYIPAYSAFITLASDKEPFNGSNIIKGKTIREKIVTEPEQTYDRACREISSLSVMECGKKQVIYLPIAADASWQKFGFEWGGSFFMDKKRTKAKGRELERCNWQGNELHWYIGTGEEPVYLRNDTVSHTSFLNDYLPVTETTWNQEGLLYREEAFATLLEGPLSPYDEQRSEQTPAVLMIKLEVSNPSGEEKNAHVWLKGKPFNRISLRNLFITDEIDNESYIRASIKLPGNDSSSVRIAHDAVHIPIVIAANQSKSVYLSVPFPGDLKNDSKEKILALNYDRERQRVISYWRDIVEECTAFNVPEQKFNELARSIITHIRMSVNKDPKSGLYMVPAASFNYTVFANEAAYQTVFLDKLGDHKTAASYLETFLQLQGRSPMPGTFTGDQSGVLNGAKVDDEYDYSHPVYNLHHGTMLWALGVHYLLSDDFEWLKHAAPNMLKAVDWIIEQRNNTKLKDKNGNPVPYYGLLPAGNLEDNSEWGFWFAVNAYTYLGLKTTAEAFKKANMPEAERIEVEAQKYLQDIRKSVKLSSELCPVVRLRNNTYIPYVPTSVFQRFRHFGIDQSKIYYRYNKNAATREGLCGPITLIETGVLDPNESLSTYILDDWEDNLTLSGSVRDHVQGTVDPKYWFSRGGMIFQPNLQNPIPVYLRRNEIPAAIRSIYNNMVSCLFPDVNVLSEEYYEWGIGSGRLYKVADEACWGNRVVDLLVLEAGNELWLAPGTPRYWLEPGDAIRLYQASTTYGKISYEMKSGSEPNSIEANIDLSFLSADPGKIVLFVHAPFEKPMKSVIINGAKWKKWDIDKEWIVLPNERKNLEVKIYY